MREMNLITFIVCRVQGSTTRTMLCTQGFFHLCYLQQVQALPPVLYCVPSTWVCNSRYIHHLFAQRLLIYILIKLQSISLFLAFNVIQGPWESLMHHAAIVKCTTFSACMTVSKPYFKLYNQTKLYAIVVPLLVAS